MSLVDGTESDSSEEEIALCIINQCLGCADCQGAEALRAREKERELHQEIDDLRRRERLAQEELEHIKLLRIAVCKHFLIVTKDKERCNRCGLDRPRYSA
jgi:AhpD family alkylhydroperoxidase